MIFEPKSDTIDGKNISIVYDNTSFIIIMDHDLPMNDKYNYCRRNPSK